jgi:arginine decarboxylase-like protein
MINSQNPVAEAIDGATGDWSMSGDAMRWSPDLADRGPGLGAEQLRGLEVAAGWGAGLGLDMDGVRRLVSGALNSLGNVASDVVSELRQLTRNAPAEKPSSDQ